MPWEDDSVPVTLARLRPRCGGRRRIAIIGGIGPSKGFDLLIACAEDASTRDLPLEFLVIGASADDREIAAHQADFRHAAAYREGEVQALIAGLKPDLAFLPSIWPETWCFALSEAWQAGLPALGLRPRRPGRAREGFGARRRAAARPARARINDILLRASL